MIHTAELASRDHAGRATTRRDALDEAPHVAQGGRRTAGDRHGTLNPGLDLGGAVNGNCHDKPDLANTNVYSRSKCNNGWCAYLYGYYFEKDQVSDGPVSAGHKHDREHIVVWVQDDQVNYISVSQHQGYETNPASAVPFQDSHPKAVYHKDGVSTHDFRCPKAGNDDEPPENDEGVDRSRASSAGTTTPRASATG
ncbi:NPP1 family protein [Amycolatopsis sp. NPDC023774]|uniref:NPP1 family protein n=1 Tax=Amycolatopsis sp. NPDC023774 TaxID=3155015 RepID=UPI00340EE44E